MKKRYKYRLVYLVNNTFFVYTDASLKYRLRMTEKMLNTLEEDIINQLGNGAKKATLVSYCRIYD